jgi:FAD:protein FMN transferase
MRPQSLSQTSACLLLAIALLGNACGKPPSASAGASDASATSSAPGSGTARMVERSFVTMGSPLKLTAWTNDEPTAVQAFEALFKEFERLDAALSIWKPGSDVVRINAAAGNRAVPVGADVLNVLAAARRVSEWTDGKFDVSFGALSDVWKFDQDKDNRIPTEAEIRARLPLINYRDINVDERAGTVALARPGMRIHLGGIGKGYAVDHGTAILRAAGVTSFMIQFGGDLYVAGFQNGRPWRLGIRDPRGPADRSFAELDLSDATFSTSGDYERFFIKDGRRYAHIIDPGTGQPARGCRSVTIVSNNATLADGLSTGVFLLGPDKGMALIERLPDVEGVIVSASNEVLVSSGLKQKILMVGKPTAGQ